MLLKILLLCKAMFVASVLFQDMAEITQQYLSDKTNEGTIAGNGGPTVCVFPVQELCMGEDS